MHSVELAGPADFGAWRNAARELLHADVPPERVQWLSTCSSGSLFEEFAQPCVPSGRSASPTVPRAFLDLARCVALHRDANKFALLYRMLWRLQSEPRLLRIAVDEDVARACAMRKSVERDIHKMHAYVRFRAAPGIEGRSIAWFEPEHYILEAAAPFFVRRFANFRWSILTPEQSAHWDLATLRFGPGGKRSDAPAEDAQEQLWRTYYASIFNPARLKVAAMLNHMPKKYWRNLPESSVIPALIAHAQSRTEAMLAKPATRQHRRAVVPQVSGSPLPAGSLDDLRRRAAACRACPLWQRATQTVCGEGPERARVVLVGEQPGDQEDIAGRPFVGPAGRLLDRALEQAGIVRTSVYVTNAVKHFKFEPRGKRRLHKKPSEAEIAACRPWLQHELNAVRPELIVALGASAARAVLGRAGTIGDLRGRIMLPGAAPICAEAKVLVTVHPSYLLRLPEEQREDAYAQFVADLHLAATEPNDAGCAQRNASGVADTAARPQ
jgi:uracil-DNA glycosylase